MPKNLKRFVVKWFFWTVWLGCVTGLFEAVGEPFAGEYFDTIKSTLRGVTLVSILVMTWRLYVGSYRTSELLMDD